jgi:hypothetical protein
MTPDIVAGKGFLHRLENFFPPDDQSLSIAVEHISYLRSIGAGMSEAMRAIDLYSSYGDGWDDVVLAYAINHERIRRSEL